VEPLLTAASTNRTEKRAITRIMDELTSITDASTPEEIYRARENIANIVEQNKDVVLDRLSDVDEPLRFNLDTVSAMARGADGPVTDQLLSLRSGLLQRSGVSSQTQSAVARPAVELQEQTEEYLRRVGGETADDQVETMAAAGREVTDEISRRVDEAQGGVRAAQESYDASVEAVRRSIRDDLEVGQQIDQLEELTGTEIVTGPSTSREQIEQGLANAYEGMKQTKNDLYAQVDGGPIDVGSLYDAFAEADLDELTKKSRDIRATSPLRELAELMQPRRVPVEGATGSRAVAEFDPTATGSAAAGDGMRLETREEVIERVQNWFARDPDKYNFGFFNNDIRNELNRAAQDFFARGEGSSAQVLRDIIKTIDGPMTDYVAQEGDPALRQAALQARDYYTNEFAPVWRSRGVMEDYAQSYDNTIARGEGFRRGFEEQSEQVVSSALTGSSPERVRSLQLALEAGGQDASPIADYFVSDAVANLWGRVRRDGIDSVNFADLEQSMRQYAEALQKTFPEKAESVNRFIGRLRQAQGDKEKLEAILKDAGSKAEEATRRLQNTEMARFLRESSEALGIAPTANPETAFREILSKGRPLDRLRRFKDEISTLPEGRRAVVQDGLETAYTRLLRQRAVGRTLELGGGRRPKTGAIEDAGEQIDPQTLIRVGREVFSDKPEVMEAIEPLMEISGMVQRSKEARPISVFSPTAFSQDAQRATNRLIYVTTGPLSRAGTRIRAALGAFVENMAPDQRAAHVMDNILADPDKFVALARQYNRNPQNAVAREELLRAMFSGVIKTDTDEGDVPAAANNVRQQMQALGMP
jgi:archaellum component FlaC